METMRQYEMNEWSIPGKEPAGSWVETDITGVFETDGNKTVVKGFYAGDGIYKVRFYPEKTGLYHVTLCGTDTGVKSFDAECVPAASGRHGVVRADGTHFRHADGTWFYPFGTTVYAISHQDEELTERTFRTLAENPFNKIRMCFFPKHYDYNHNEPPYFAFKRRPDATDAAKGYTENDPSQWDVHHPDTRMWDRIENHIRMLDSLGIQSDLILFHAYDRWGFSKLPIEDALIYLDYVTRRLSAFPNVWWSMANEYDIVGAYGKNDWERIAHYLHENDPYGHLLSNHQMLHEWDYANEDTTHISTQTSDLEHLNRKIRTFGKPLSVDECRYEGNLPFHWGNVSAFEMVHRFWTVAAQGGYCTHGETYLNDENIIWWSRGGELVGESPARIRFLRGIIEELPGPLTYCGRDKTKEEFEQAKKMIPESAAAGNSFLKLMLTFPYEEAVALLESEPAARFEDKAFLKYFGRNCAAYGSIDLPKTGSYQIEVIDVWEMTRTVVQTGVNGTVEVQLPSKEGIAVLAKLL